MNETWEEGISEEIKFWEEWFREKGGAWPHEYAFRVDPDTHLQPEFRECIDAPEGARVRILDVGAGPLTLIGKQWPGRTVDIFPTDALADDYEKLLAKYAVIPPVKTLQVRAEELSSAFDADFFDLAYAKNSLDHCFDPLTAIRQMLMVTKPGALVFLSHAVMEGKKENYVGFHQWDLFHEDGDFIISGRSSSPFRRINVSRALSDIAGISCDATDDWINVFLRKR